MENKNTSGFKFAIVTLTAIVTFSITLYTKIQNTAIEPKIYGIFILMITSSIISSFYIFCYIFIKGISMEIQGHKKNRLEDLASEIYVISFFVSLLTFILLFNVGLSTFFNISNIYVYLVSFIFMIIIFSSYRIITHENPTLEQYIFRKKLSEPMDLKKDKVPRWFFYFMSGFRYFMLIIEKKTKLFSFFILILPSNLLIKKNIPINLETLMMITILISLFIFTLCFISFSSIGYVNVDMENVYHKDNTQIPVYVAVTGLNTDLTIKLLKENSDHQLILFDNITLEVEHNSDKTIYGKNSTFVGNALGYGKYNLFINTTNLTTGYYELVCLQTDLQSDKNINGFYLLN